MLSARLQLYLCINETLVKLKLNLTAEDLVNWGFFGIFFCYHPLFFIFGHRALLLCFSITQFYATTVDELIF